MLVDLRICESSMAFRTIIIGIRMFGNDIDDRNSDRILNIRIKTGIVMNMRI